tara:strand:- start:4203 stop:5357 length:1155 start_codon:yes stop_codon:yes gene_type:complete
MKNLLIGIAILILFSCSSSPKIKTEKGPEERLIEKPQINYKLNSLPKGINVIYFSDLAIKEPFPDEVKGLLTNYYSFSKNREYFPDINFIDLNEEDSCSFNFDKKNYNLIFLLKNSLNKRSEELCLNRFTNNQTLVISDSDNTFIPKNLKTFLINRDDDKSRLIKLMSSYSDNIMIIDNDVTKDKYEIGEMWKNKFNKKVSEYKTLNKKESNQSIFSNLLLIEQSLKRKRKLSRIISKDLEHKSRARKDIDTLILSVNTQEARSLKPALDYSYFEGMEVFLINDWAGDIRFNKTDKDLENVISIDIPFLLPTDLPESLELLQNKTRNFAIGYDAFEIVLLIKGTNNLDKITYKGLTGQITIKDKNINRKSIIFVFKNGIYEYLN